MIARPPADDPVLTRWSIVLRDWLGSDTLRGISFEAECLFTRLCMDQMEHGAAIGDKEHWRRAHGHRIHHFDEAWSQALCVFLNEYDAERALSVARALADSTEGVRYLVNERVSSDRERAVAEIQAKVRGAAKTNEKRRSKRPKAGLDAERSLTERSCDAGGSLKGFSASASASVSDTPPTPPPGEREALLFGEQKPEPSKAETRRAGRQRKVDPETVPLPPSINTPAVREALVRYLRNRKGGVWNETLAGDQLRILARWGPERAVAALEHSLGAQGLFEPRGANGVAPRGVAPNGAPTAPPVRTYRELT